MYYYRIFPFDRVKPGSRIVLYGGGLVGWGYYTQIEAIHYCDVLFVADQRDETPYFGRDKVRSPEELAGVTFDHLVIAVAEKPMEEEMRLRAEGLGVAPEKIVASNDGTIEMHKMAPLLSLPTFSEGGEDLIVCNIFNRLGIERPSYIDAGAFHPYVASQTALLHSKGGRGINIDPTPGVMDVFDEARKDDINLRVGIGPVAGSLSFYTFGASGPYNTLSYASAKEFEKILGRPVKEVIEIPVLTLPSVVARYADGRWPDFLSIDIEGMDYAVLSSLDLREGPAVICTEVSYGEGMPPISSVEDAFSEMEKMMATKGYRPFYRSTANIVFVRRDYSDRLRAGESQ